MKLENSQPATLNSTLRVIISGGGTGGHIFPAVAIADAIKAKVTDTEFLFVGANGRMEMEKVPAAGYNIVGLDIAGLQRKFTFSNFLLPFKVIGSLLKSRKIIKDFKPHVAIGVGGYASGPLLKMAQWQGIPTLIQEQNGFAGKTNIVLGKKAHKICVAYEGMERFFPKSKIVLTGNPVRKSIKETILPKLAGSLHYKMAEDRTTVLVIGGSLGARTINESVAAGIEKLKKANIQLIWQTGKSYYMQARELTLQQGNGWGEPKTFDFISSMDLAYAAADIVISRAGALSVSELCCLGKAAILVPSPNVAEDHQTQNAMALVNKGAAILVKDLEAKETLIDTVIALAQDQQKLETLRRNIKQLAKPHADVEIADIAVALARKANSNKNQ
ncbi:MAG TPA: undecaprenyldiphospho-muramoylpentapeptide beta-N-acetylglucosaminyltransferase [Cytophagales bacterium]|nr:undecaprenyldiphospho-muramoylpentapeptide beta-N-acetylglucosaminyltransferase [Cytophagales bacterium]